MYIFCILSGLDGADTQQRAQVDMVLECTLDIRTTLYKAWTEKDTAKQVYSLTESPQKYNVVQIRIKNSPPVRAISNEFPRQIDIFQNSLNQEMSFLPSLYNDVLLLMTIDSQNDNSSTSNCVFDFF